LAEEARIEIDEPELLLIRDSQATTLVGEPSEGAKNTFDPPQKIDKARVKKKVKFQSGPAYEIDDDTASVHSDSTIRTTEPLMSKIINALPLPSRPRSATAFRIPHPSEQFLHETAQIKPQALQATAQ
jgi:hypothetical protein